MKFQTPLTEARLTRRYKRFLADVEYPDGSTETVHCPNPGAMVGLDAPGSPAWISRSANPRRKLPATLEIVRPAGGPLVGVNTNLPNALAEEAIRAGRIAGLTGWTTLRREVRYGVNSRIDILLEGDHPPIHVEVKNVHFMREDGLAEFPDCVTARGAKHLRELSDVVAGGGRAMMLYVVQREDCARFSLAADIDPGYAQAFAAARAAGVEALAHACRVAPEGIEITTEMPVEA